jgi:hypothetical protein
VDKAVNTTTESSIADVNKIDIGICIATNGSATAQVGDATTNKEDDTRVRNVGNPFAQDPNRLTPFHND